MITKTIWNRESSQHLLSLPVMAMDVGYSATARSCGLAWAEDGNRGSDEMTHQAAITRLIEWLSGQDESVLILEAPLSTAYREGNPAMRGPFEQQKTDSTTKTRVWYSGPGAAVTLAALNILRRLQMEAALAATTVHLLEGFVSFGDLRSHREVAESLRDALIRQTGTWHQVDAALETLTVTALLGIEGTTQPPAIIVPPSV